MGVYNIYIYMCVCVCIHIYIYTQTGVRSQSDFGNVIPQR